MAKTTAAKASTDNGGVGDYQATLWAAADKLRNNLDAAEYKHVVLGLIFLKYISDAFEEKHAALAADVASGAEPEDPDEYRADNVFWVPLEARWPYLVERATQEKIGKYVDEAMLAIERENPALKGVLPKEYARPALGDIGFKDKQKRGRDVLGEVYMYFLGRFAAAEGKRGGQFYTPKCIVELLVTMLPVDLPDGQVHLREAPRRRVRLLAVDADVADAPAVRLDELLAVYEHAARAAARVEHAALERCQFSSRSAQGSQGRLHPRQPSVQRLGLGWRAAAGGRAVEVRRAARGERQLRLGAALPPPPVAGGGRGVRARERELVVAAVGRGGDPQGDSGGGSGRLHRATSFSSTASPSLS